MACSKAGRVAFIDDLRLQVSPCCPLGSLRHTGHLEVTRSVVLRDVTHVGQQCVTGRGIEEKVWGCRGMVPRLAVYQEDAGSSPVSPAGRSCKDRCTVSSRRNIPRRLPTYGRHLAAKMVVSKSTHASSSLAVRAQVTTLVCHSYCGSGMNVIDDDPPLIPCVYRAMTIQPPGTFALEIAWASTNPSVQICSKCRGSCVGGLLVR